MVSLRTGSFLLKAFVYVQTYVKSDFLYIICFTVHVRNLSCETITLTIAVKDNFIRKAVLYVLVLTRGLLELSNFDSRDKHKI